MKKCKKKNNKCSVELLHNTPIEVIDTAIGTCWDKQKDEIDFERMDRVVNKFKHASTSEHATFNFYIKNVSRAYLQENSRHRIASPSVKSSRYTLKELKKEDSFCSYDLARGEVGANNLLKIIITEDQLIRASKYIKLTGTESTDLKSISALEQLRQEVVSGTANDISKYCLPDAYKTELTWSINVRSLKNFISLRTDKSALWEIREVAYEIYAQIPEEYKFFFDVYKDKEDKDA